MSFVPMAARIYCPICGVRHIDEGEWQHRPHHTHLCARCGAEWRVEGKDGLYFYGCAEPADAAITDNSNHLGHDYAPIANMMVCNRCGMRSDPARPMPCAERLAEQLALSTKERAKTIEQLAAVTKERDEARESKRELNTRWREAIADEKQARVAAEQRADAAERRVRELEAALEQARDALDVMRVKEAMREPGETPWRKEAFQTEAGKGDDNE